LYSRSRIVSGAASSIPAPGRIFRGKIHVIGLSRPAMPIFLPQARLTLWKQEIGFAAHPKPDFPHEPSA
jgi:hypothetical protein